jgi:SAM-dependent methyltransferase
MRDSHKDYTKASRELWDQIWEDPSNSLNPHPEMLNAFSRVLKVHGAKILEIGCGRAVDSMALSKLGARVSAIDYSMNALQRAKQVSSLARTEVLFTAGDTFHLPYPAGSFDLVFSQGLLEHFPDPKPVIREQVRVINEGGFIGIDVPQTYSLYSIYKRALMKRGRWFAGWETNFSLRELESLLRSFGLVVCKSYGYMYFPSFVTGIRNMHTFDERYNIPLWVSPACKENIEGFWLWLEKQRWYYSKLVNIGVIAQKVG